MLLWLLPSVLLLFLFFFLRRALFFQDLLHVLTRLRNRHRVLQYSRTNFSILDRFLELGQSQPHKHLVLFQDDAFTYREADALSDRAAQALLRSGRLRPGDTVALFMENQPEFLWLWLGLAKLGCPAALLNSNIRAQSLLHCLGCSRASTLLASADLQEAVEEILPTLVEQQVSVFILADRCTSPHMQSFTEMMRQASSEPVPRETRSHVNMRSPAVYIYTSGTTGFPKAAVVTHGKLWYLSLTMLTAGVKSSDVIYTSLPLYHTAGLIGFLATIERGATLALRRKFSASRFWDNCRKYDVTVIQYIGEIIRYLCCTPKKPGERSHRVRVAIGNGMRPDVWRDFLDRFGDIQIREFYGATEGNFSLSNYSGRVGAVGRHSFLSKWFFPYALIKFDVDRGEPLRDSNGFYIQVDKGEPGLLVCEITPRTPFAGYAGDLQQTEKKRLHDVLRRGDLFFNTGDLLRVDQDNFIYFHDRVGDTFRWKGENVSTTEVGNILTLCDCIKEANVYGVTVPGSEGRAGMAAIICTEGRSFDPEGVFKHVVKLLPSYARPRFLRIKSSMDVTGTFKHLKMKLVDEGFDPGQVSDRLYFLHEQERSYVPLTPDVFASVSSGKMKM